MSRARPMPLLRAAHSGPALAVTVLAAAYGVSDRLPPGSVLLVALAVLAGQLSIGWSNDVIDAGRDLVVGRSDKPLATGELRRSTVQAACGTAVAGTVVLSLLCGSVAGPVHLGCVAAAWCYNLGVKATAFSWLPYAVAFGGLPVFVSLAGPDAGLPPWWVPAAAALLGVGAHLVNVLPDLADDEATGVRGLPHRIGPRPTSLLAVTVLAAASVLLVAGTRSVPPAVVGLVLGAVLALAGLALVAGGRGPFRAAIGIAVVDVLLLVVAR